VSVEKAYLAGWYVAEGHCATVQQVCLSLNNLKDNIDRIQECAVTEFGKKFVPYGKRKSCTQWYLNSKVAKEFFSQFGTSCYDKSATDLIKGATPVSKLAFLSAYFSGDGHDDGMSLSAVSTSLQLINDISDILMSLGLSCTIRRFAKSGTYGVIEGRHYYASDSWEIKLCGNNRRVVLGMPTVCRPSSSFVDGGFFYSRISSIQAIPYAKESVYDLEVDTDHSYVGLHGTFHNCVPISDDSTLFPERILQENYRTDLSLVTDMTEALRKEYTLFTGVDLAMSASVGADYTVVTTIGVDRYQNRRIFDIRRMKGRSMSEQLHEIESVYNQFRPERVFIEDNQFQRVFRDELVRNTDIPVQGYTTTANAKNSLERGVPSLQILFENQKFQIPRMTERDRRVTDELLHELKCFSFVNGKLQGLGAHDDCVMSLWIATEASRESQFSFSFA
jgi:hypothetical protein